MVGKGLGSVVCVALVGVIGCKKLLSAAIEDGADASEKVSPPASVAATNGAPPAAATPAFANVGDIARYPDEKPFAAEKASVHTNMLARESVPSGAVVGTILAGKPVTKIAAHEGFVLVSFADPKDPSRTLLGWMAQGGLAPAGGAMTATVPAGGAKTKGAKCPAGQVSFVGFGCKVECPDDDDCKKAPGTTCVGGQFIEGEGAGFAPGRACLPTPKGGAKKCKAGEIIANDECVVSCDPDAPKCPTGKTCQLGRFNNASGDSVVGGICQ